MKIAIQGHATRFKEVIDILVNLGGINKYNYGGNGSFSYYYIGECKYIEKQFLSKLDTNKLDTNVYKLYTLEEFEKEFPFKIGDKVIILNCGNQKGTVVNITCCGPTFHYFIKLKSGNGLYRPATQLKLDEEMKEERNITLTLNKAKEWYSKGGELKEIALQAYTKEELNPLPKSWEEYCKGNKVPEFIFGPCIPNKYVTLWKLEQLRDCYRQGWIPDWTDAHTNKYCIYYSNNELNIMALTYTCEFLSFQSEKVAEEFLKNFESLIKEAGDLI